MAMINIKFANQTHPVFDESRTQMQLHILEQGSETWNRWRFNNPDEYIDLRGVSLFGKNVSLQGADLSEANLAGAIFGKIDLRGANLSAAYANGADFQGTNLDESNLQGAYLADTNFTLAHLARADLRVANLSSANLMMVDGDGANLRKANLSGAIVFAGSFVGSIIAQANLSDATLRDADLTDVNLSGSNLNGTNLVGANLERADLSGCRVFGTSVWKSNLQDTKQTNLRITPDDETEITVDNLKVAQFIYLILNNSEVRDVIDTITSKVVLIIGRFTPERKSILDAIRDELRKWDYTPIMFDFTRPASKNYIETVNTLTSMSRFVIADVTDAKVVIQEIHSIVRDFPSVPIQPLLLKGAEPTSVLIDFMDFPTFLPIHQYSDEADLLSTIEENVIVPAETKAREIRERRKNAEIILSRLSDPKV